MFENFARLHLEFASKVAVVIGLDLFEALRCWTPAVRLAGAYWPEAALDPTRLASAYSAHFHHSSIPQPGYFSWSAEQRGRVVRLHFANREGRGTLSAGQAPTRRAELAAVIEAARAAYPRARTVRGGSWLYHLPAYRALFPPALLAAATPANPAEELEFMALWGQFVRGDMDLYEPRARQFAGAFVAARDRTELLASFPLTKLDWHGPIDELAAFLDRTNSSK